MHNSIIKVKRSTPKQWLHAILGISGNHSQTLPDWKTLNCKWSFSFRTSFCLYEEVLLWKQKLLKMGRHFYPHQFITFPRESFRILYVRGFWESSLPILYPPPLPSPNNLLQVMSGSSNNNNNNNNTIRNHYVLPRAGRMGNKKRTNFSSKCFRASVFHINYYLVVCLTIFHHSQFS